MAFTFNQVAAAGDVLPHNRHSLIFPNLPNGGNGYDLSIRNTTVSFTPWEVGQIIVKMYGWSVAFAGRRNNPNTFSCAFLETTDAPVIKTLLGWQSACSGFKKPNGLLKSKYAVKAKLYVYDTAGNKAFTVILYNVWPQSITFSDIQEDSGAAEVTVNFSIDAMDIESLNFSEQGIAGSSTGDVLLGSVDAFRSTAGYNPIGVLSQISNTASQIESAYNSTTNLFRSFGLF